MRRLLGVDSGKYDTKAKMAGLDRRMRFRTKMDVTKETMPVNGKSCVLQFNGVNYLIGEEAENISYDKSKMQDIHKLATYAAISQFVDNGDNVDLVIGCPLSIFQNVAERDIYKNFMFSDRDIECVINGKTKNFRIDNMLVAPEGSGVIYNNITKYENRLVAVIDIGGLNTNNMVWDCMNPIKSSSFTTNLGTNIMKVGLLNEINSAFPEANIQQWQIEDILRKGYIKSHKEESAALISDYCQGHIEKILAKCKEKGWDLANLDFVFTGGGSMLLKNGIILRIPDAEISDNAEWDNVDGFVKLGEAKFGGVD